MRGKVNSPKAKSERKPSPVARVARAVNALRRGKAVVIRGDKPITILAVETASDVAVKQFVTKERAFLLLTHARARTLKIRLYTNDVVALPIERGTSLRDLRAIADPTEDLAFPLKGPFETLRETLPTTFARSIRLAKLAGLLPATIARRGAQAGAIAISAADIAAYAD